MNFLPFPRFFSIFVYELMHHHPEIPTLPNDPPCPIFIVRHFADASNSHPSAPIVIPRDFLEYVDTNETIVRFYYSELYLDVVLPEPEPAPTSDHTDSSQIHNATPAHSSQSQNYQNSSSSSSSSSSSDPSLGHAPSPPRPTAQCSPTPRQTTNPIFRVRLPTRPKRIRHRTPTPEPENDPSPSNQTHNNPDSSHDVEIENTVAANEGEIPLDQEDEVLDFHAPNIL